MEISEIPARRYKFLLTVARRAGIEDISVQAILPGGRRLRVHLAGDVDGSQVEVLLKAALAENGFSNIAVRKYLGSDILMKNNKSSCCFRFLVSAAPKTIKNNRQDKSS